MCHVPLALQRVYGQSNIRGENGDGVDRNKISGGGGERERDWRMPGIPYADDLVLCGGSEEELNVTGRGGGAFYRGV